MTTKITASVIEPGAISTASLADTSITAAKLAGTLDLTGKTVTVATATAGDNDTTVASTAFVTTAIANLTDSAPAALDTLNELAAALNDDANFSTTVTNSIALKAPLASPTFTGTPLLSNRFKTQDGSAQMNIGQWDGSNHRIEGDSNRPLKIYSYNTSGGIALGISGSDKLTINGDGSGVTVTGDLNFGDSDKAIFGAGSDLQIYHDGSNSVIKDAGTGALKIQGSAWTIIEGATSGTWGVAHYDGAQTNLYHNGNLKLATTSTGIDITGNIVVSGTVDGRDVATDGTKLDGIEANATADQTQSEINALGITATGLSGTPNITVGTISSGVHTITSSGTIGGAAVANGYLKITDNTHTMAFDTNEIHTTDNLYLLAEAGNIIFRDTGNGGVVLKNGVTQFMDASRNLTNIGTISSGAVTLADGSHIQTYTSNGTTGTGGVHLPRGGHITFYGNNNNDHSIGSRSSAGTVTDDLRISSYGALYIDLDSNNNNTSTADFVIGRHGSGDGTMSTLLTISGEDGSITLGGTVDGVDIAVRDGVLTSTTTTANAALPKSGGTMTGTLDLGTTSIAVDSDKGFVNSGPWTRNTTPYGYIALGPANGSHAHIYTDRSDFYFNKTVLYANSSSNLIWHAGNDGSGSGLDADTLDGLNVHNTQGTQNGADQILRTQVNGYTMLGWINTTSGVASGTPTRIYCSQDSYIRYYTPASLAPYILNQGSTKNAHVHSEYFNTGRTLTAINTISNGGDRYDPSTNNPTNAHYAVLTYGNGGNVTGQLATHFQTGNLYSRGYNSSWSAWRTYWNSLNDGSGSGLDADLLDGLNAKGVGSATGASQVLTSNTNSYFVHQNWIDIGASGIYSTTTNAAHFRPNTITSYGTWVSSGSRNGYDGIVFDGGGDVALMFDAAGNGGFYRQANARWMNYHHIGNACTGFNASTTSSAYTIYVTGAIYATGNVVAYSDRRIKENVVQIDTALEKVNKLRGVYYNRIDDEDKEREIGFIAQEVNEVAPELVTYAEDVDQYGVKYGNTTALLVEAVKELTQQVKDLKQEIEEIKNVK